MFCTQVRSVGRSRIHLYLFAKGLELGSLAIVRLLLKQTNPKTQKQISRYSDICLESIAIGQT